MASLRQALSYVLSDAKDGIAWLVVWKCGRSWNADAVYINYNERTSRFENIDEECITKFAEAVKTDNKAIIVNAYYCNLGSLEEMTLASLVDGVRWQYELQHSLLSDVLDYVSSSKKGGESMEEKKVITKVGYCRVSTAEQHIDRQRTALADCDDVYIDYCSGKDTNRPELQRLLADLDKGEIKTVVCESYSRLARNTKDLLKLIDTFDAKGIQFISLKENVDTGTPTGRLAMTIFGAIAEFEREITLQRIAEGRAEAKRKDALLIAEGKPPKYYAGGHKLKVDKAQFKREYERWKSGEQSAVATMQKLKLKPNTFYRRVKEYEQALKKE